MQDRNFYKDTYLCKLSPRERKTAATMHDYGFAMRGDSLASLVGFPYRGDNFRVLMSNLRSKLRGTGWTVSLNEGGTTVGMYALVQE